MVSNRGSAVHDVTGHQGNPVRCQWGVNAHRAIGIMHLADIQFFHTSIMLLFHPFHPTPTPRSPSYPVVAIIEGRRYGDDGRADNFYAQFFRCNAHVLALNLDYEFSISYAILGRINVYVIFAHKYIMLIRQIFMCPFFVASLGK